MADKINILLFPAGSEVAIDIYDSLKYNLHFNVFGASGISDHAEFVYSKETLCIDDLYITNEDFMDRFNKIIELFMISYIIPTHDTIAAYLIKNQDQINANVVCSPYETARVAADKWLTYETLGMSGFYPKVYQAMDEIERFPVFLKPYIGAGGRGTHLVHSKQELEDVLSKNTSLLISEYLPGNEYTVDCFTNKKGELLFVGPRKRGRITMGISFRSERVDCIDEFQRIATYLNQKFRFRGAWFFQVKEDELGKRKIMEFSVRQAGTMGFYRQLGVNFPALSLYDAMGLEVKILFNDYKLILDRSLKNCYQFGYQYETVYLEFDNTLIVQNRVNTTLMKLLYQCLNNRKKVFLLTKQDIEEAFRTHRISRELFDGIVCMEQESKITDYIEGTKPIFIGSCFLERSSVSECCHIPVFDVDAVECLIDSCQF